MSKPDWRFREKQRGEMHQDPANTEFFAQQDVADRLIRESGQNTIDATLEGSMARLVFTFGETEKEVSRRYFSGLWPHLRAQSELRENLPCQNGPVPYLLVEDFGTTGLTGVLHPDNMAADDFGESENRLFWFFMNVGRTSKSDRQLGSFGIGKTVFPYSSKINSFFGYTIRDDSKDTVLVGQSQLKEHGLGDASALDPFGFYANHERIGNRPVMAVFPFVPCL